MIGGPEQGTGAGDALHGTDKRLTVKGEQNNWKE